MPGKTRQREPEELAAFLARLLEERNETMRHASLAAGLEHGAMHRYIKERRRPRRESCIALADHFGINPNELLVRAGYEPMAYFDPSLLGADDYPPEVKEVATLLTRIPGFTARREMCQAVREVVALYLRAVGSNQHPSRSRS